MKLQNFVLDLLFPGKCLICRKILNMNDTRDVCDGCLPKLPYAGDKGFTDKYEFLEAVCSPYFYKGELAEAIKRFKFNNCKGYYAFFACEMAEYIRLHLNGKFDVITWIPISSKRMRTRGYNQAQLLAEKIAQILDIDASPMLIKYRDNPPQSGIKKIERRKANVSGVYKLAADVGGKRVLIIDDIVTSGATLSECAMTLLLGGAECVYGATIATAHRKKKKRPRQIK